MRSRFHWALSTAALGAVALLVGPAPAEATLQLRLVASSGTTSFTRDFVDSSNSGSISFNRTIDSGANGTHTSGSVTFSVQGLSTTSNSPGTDGIGGLPGGNLFTSFTNVSSTGAGTLMIEVTDNDYTSPVSASYNNLVSSIAPNSSGSTASNVSFSYQSYADGANGNPFATPVTAPAGVSTNLQGPYIGAVPSNVTSRAFPPYGSNGFALLGIITLNFTAAGSVSFNTTTAVTAPEPATLAMALAGLPVACLMRRRQRRRDAAVTA